MPKRSPFTDVVLELREEMSKLQHDTRQNQAVAFMREEVSKPQAVRRLMEMSPQERVQMMREMGVEKTANLIVNRPDKKAAAFPESRRKKGRDNGPSR